MIKDEKENKIWVASFDIGKINFAFYIEEIDIYQLKNTKNISKLKRYNTDGTCTSDFSEILDNVFRNGKKILLKKFNISQNIDKKKYFDLEICHNMFDVLDEYKDYWNNVSYFIVEQQMSFGKKCNTMALKIGQHCESYFMFKYGRFKNVIEFPSYHKTQILGFQKILKKSKNGKTKYISDAYKRKKWAIEIATYILTQREDFETLEYLLKNKKKDDISDTIIQLQAWKYLNFIDK